MCIICVEIAAGRLTAYEARRNVREMASSIPEDHREDLIKAIFDKEEEEDKELYYFKD